MSESNRKRDALHDSTHATNPAAEPLTSLSTLLPGSDRGAPRLLQRGHNRRQDRLGH